MPDHIEDPPEILTQLRSVCLGLPEVQEEHAWAGTRWRIESALSRCPYRRHHCGPVTWVKFRSAGPERDVLLAVGHPFSRGGAGASVVSMTLDADTDWSEVAELLVESYRLLAPKRLAALADPRAGSGLR